MQVLNLNSEHRGSDACPSTSLFNRNENFALSTHVGYAVRLSLSDTPLKSWEEMLKIQARQSIQLYKGLEVIQFLKRNGFIQERPRETPTGKSTG